MRIRDGSFLVTGGASFIGLHVAEALLAAGAEEVRILDNLSYGRRGPLERVLDDGRARFFPGDVRRFDELLPAVEGVDGVFHLAAVITRPLADRPEEGLDVNVRGTASVLAAAQWAGASKVVLSSSVAVYGDVSGTGIAEDSPFRHASAGWVPALYGGCKVLAETLCRLYGERHGLDHVMLRYPTVYGPRQHGYGVHTRLLVDLYRAIRRGERPRLPGDGSAAHDYLYVTDVASANVRAMEAAVTGEAFNVATGVSTSEAEVVRILLDLAGSALEPVYDTSPGGAADPPRALSYDVDKAHRMLGWRAEVPVAEGVARLVETLDAGEPSGAAG